MNDKDRGFWAIFLVDRRKLGGPVKAINRRYPARKTTFGPNRVKTFESQKLAKRFLREKVKRDKRYRYIVETV
jgi:hypothetical protein